MDFDSLQNNYDKREPASYYAPDEHYKCNVCGCFFTESHMIDDHTCDFCYKFWEEDNITKRIKNFFKQWRQHKFNV